MLTARANFKISKLANMLTAQANFKISKLASMLTARANFKTLYFFNIVITNHYPVIMSCNHVFTNMKLFIISEKNLELKVVQQSLTGIHY